MPWCPVCKNEYTEGVEVCADCGAVLVDSLKERKEVLLCSGEEALILRMQKFMEYNDIPVVFEREEEHACLYILPKHERKAKQAAQVFLAESAAEAAKRGSSSKCDADVLSDGDDLGQDGDELWKETDCLQDRVEGVPHHAADSKADHTDLQDNAADSKANHTDLQDNATGLKADHTDLQDNTAGSKKAADDPQNDDEKIGGLRAQGGVYRKKSERADDLKSSGEVLLVFGILGCIAMLLIDLGILPIRFGNRIMMNVIMFAMFFFFIGFGISSLRGARKFRSEASEEDALTERIDQWVKEYLTVEDIDEAAGIEEADAEEIRFFKRTEAIRQKIADEFAGVEEAYLDSLAENVYQELFE